MAPRRDRTKHSVNMIMQPSKRTRQEEINFPSDSEFESAIGDESGSECMVSEHSTDTESNSDEAPEDKGVPVPQAHLAQAGRAQIQRAAVADVAQARQRVQSVTSGSAVPAPWVAPNMVQPVVPEFTGTPGCTVDTANFAPIDYFQLFVDEQFMEEMVVQTNMYADAYLKDHSAALPCKSRALHWSPTNELELKQFWGLSLLMGILRKPSVASYWSGHPALLSPIFPATMSKDRFQLLQNMLHFSDNASALPRAHPAVDRFFKVRPVLDHFAHKFSTVYLPNKNISVDEPLVLFKGRLLPKQYIQSKRTRDGIKLHMLFESDSGYVYSFRLYAGKDFINPPGCPATLSVWEKIAWDLTSPLFHRGYHLYLDDLYAGITLFKELYAMKTVACGMIRSNQKDFPKQLVGNLKGIPKQLVCKKLERGGYSALRCNEVLAVKFRDRNDVYVLSTIHDDSTQPISANGEVGEVQKPNCIIEYNKYMDGEDKTDQLLEPSNSALKTRKWYKQLAIHMMQLAMLNAFVVYCKTTTGKKMPLLDFELAIINSLICIEIVGPVASGVEDIDRLSQRHFLDILPPTAKKDFPTRRCRLCFKQGIRRESRYFCPQCPSKPGLCMLSCFKLYHTKVKYWEMA